MIDAYRHLVKPDIRRRFVLLGDREIVGFVAGACDQWVVVERTLDGVRGRVPPAQINMDHVLFYHEEAK